MDGAQKRRLQGLLNYGQQNIGNIDLFFVRRELKVNHCISPESICVEHVRVHCNSISIMYSHTLLCSLATFL